MLTVRVLVEVSPVGSDGSIIREDREVTVQDDLAFTLSTDEEEQRAHMKRALGDAGGVVQALADELVSRTQDHIAKLAGRL